MAQSNGDEELREKILHILIDEYKQNCNYDALMAITHEVNLDRKQHELEARISELERLKKCGYYPFYSDEAEKYTEKRIDQLKGEGSHDSIEQ